MTLFSIQKNHVGTDFLNLENISMRLQPIRTYILHTVTAHSEQRDLLTLKQNAFFEGNLTFTVTK